MLADSQKGKEQPKKDAPKNVEVTVKCTIAEFYNGSIKKVKYQRQKIGLDGRTYTTVEETQQI